MTFGQTRTKHYLRGISRIAAFVLHKIKTHGIISLCFPITHWIILIEVIYDDG